MDFETLKDKLAGDLYGYKSIPFWSWNNSICEDELIKQIEEMNSVGIGGFIIHARSGLKDVEYLSDEWFRLVGVCLKKAKELHMEAWIYDENGWPSGIVGGKLLENPNFWASYIYMEKTTAFDETALSVYVNEDGKFRRVLSFVPGKSDYYAVKLAHDPSYVDVINTEVVDTFIKETHEKYYEKFKDSFGKELVGFFTDEPQCCPRNVPYSVAVKNDFTNRGKDVLDGLIYLFFDDEQGYEFRYEYYLTINRLYAENYYKRLYDWCDSHGVKFTGHSINEEKLSYQMLFNGGVTTSYEYEHIPAVDWLGRECETLLTFKQVGSLASQLGKKSVLTETFACSGFDTTPKELKGIAEMQYFHGVNKMCQHLFPYSLSSQGKQDCPPIFSKSSNWFDDFKTFNTYFDRLGYIISNTDEKADVAVIHPIRSLYLHFHSSECQKFLDTTDAEFEKLLNTLSTNGVSYHLVDETILEKYGSTDGKTLKVGNAEYSTVIIPPVTTIGESTYETLVSFHGKLAMLSKIEYIDGKKYDVRLKGNTTLENVLAMGKYRFKTMEGKAFLTERKGEIGTCVFVKNISKDVPCKVEMQGIEGNFACLDLETLTLSPAKNEYTLGGAESKILYKIPFESETKYSVITEDITSSFKTAKISDNYFVNDRAIYSFDGVTYSEEQSVLEIFNRLLYKNYKGKLYIRQNIRANGIFPARLMTEKAKYNYITFNGTPLVFENSGFDLGFQECDVTKLLQNGTNVLEYCIDFFEHDGVHFALYDASASESLRNCLYFDTSVEPTYLIGRFVVEKDFSLSPETMVSKFDDFRMYGFPFFFGQVDLEGTVNYSGQRKAVLSLVGRFLTAKITVNGKEKTFVLDDKGDISDLLKTGENNVKISLRSSLRNLLGPHHYICCNEEFVFNPNFTMRGEWRETDSENFTPNYAIVRFGIDKILLTTESKGE